MLSFEVLSSQDGGSIPISQFPSKPQISVCDSWNGPLGERIDSTIPEVKSVESTFGIYRPFSSFPISLSQTKKVKVGFKKKSEFL